MTRLVILPYLQRWDGDTLSVRLLFGPQGNPMDALLPGEPAFTEADFQLDVRLVQGLAALPTLGGAATTINVASPAPARAIEICKALERTLPIDTTVPPVDPRASGARFLKYAPPPYRQATGMSGSASPYVFTDERYRCAVKGAPPSGTVLKSDPPKIPWGKVMALALRQPLLAEDIGLVRPIEIEPPADFFVDGGWIYVSIGAGGEAAALATTPGALKLYAARVPPLDDPRSLFSSVLFPVAAVPPAASYDELFQEVIEYDDGFAKAVYASQPRRADPLQEDDDGTRPPNDVGAQIGWDDEQVARWLNRPVDPTLATQDAPTGVLGYRVDARKQGDADWQSLVEGETRLVLDGLDLGSHSGEFHVEVAPNKLMGDTSGAYWMPSYFTSWRGPALVGPDPTELALHGVPVTSTVTGTPPELALRYGQTYEFRTRLVDHTGGGPALDEVPQNPSAQPIATLAFQRWVQPQVARLATDLPVVPDPINPPDRIDVKRPLLGYPAYVFAGGSAADLIADIPAAQADRRGVGRPDPDVLTVEITVEVDDPAASGFARIYQTSRSFPADPTQTLQLQLSWRDVKDAATLVAPAAGPLPLPTARTVRLGIVAVGRADAGYFGAEDARRGTASYVTLRRESADERSLWLPFTPSEALRGIFLQPDAPVDRAVLIAQRAAGRALAAPDNALGRLAEALDLAVSGNALRARTGRRVLFGCSPKLRHVIGPDGASVTFASIGDLTQLWIVAVRLELDRDWSWDALQYVGVERGGVAVGRVETRRSIAQEARAGAPHQKSEVVYLDALDPKPDPGQFPAELDLAYKLVPAFRAAPVQSDAPLELSIHLPVTTPPAQIPRLASAGIALSQYQRSADYSRTEPRQRALWLEFEDPPADPHDGFFARVLANAPDQALLRNAPDASELAEPPLPVDPEPVRTIVPGQSDDEAGLGAMQPLVPTDSPRHFLVPLPPGLTEDSPELFGFFTYELRAGHREGWSTAQGRFGRALRVTGVQHPAPTLVCQVIRTRRGIEVTAPFANPILARQSIRPLPPVTQLWALLYVQVVQADGADHRNVLLDARLAPFKPNKWDDKQLRRLVADAGTATWSNGEVADLCRLLGLSGDAPLSCLVVETLPGDQPVPEPVSASLGYERFLRTSPLTPVPEMCV